MIPEFDEHGYLPPGVHPATLAEIEERFGSDSEIRRVQFESLIWLAEAAAMSDVLRVVINGSFVTDIVEPNDVDCLLLVGDDFRIEGVKEQRLPAEYPFLDLQFCECRGISGVYRFFAHQTWYQAHRDQPTHASHTEIR